MSTDRIADPSDLATAQEAQFLTSALSTRKPEAPPANGFCFNCETPLPKGHRWCDAECRDDWEKFEAATGCPTCGE